MHSAEEVGALLASFSSPLNADVTRFIRSTAVRFEQAHASRTYLILDDDAPARGVIAYFSLSFKEIVLCAEVSKGIAKKLDGVSNKAEQVRVYLLGQVGKSESAPDIGFPQILEYVLSCVSGAYEAVGGRALLLECEDTPKLVAVYQRAGFARLQRSGDLLQMYQALNFRAP